jgi:thioesterase domain-containing protein
MPFTKFTNSSYEQSHTNDPENLPIFLIPGILGNGNELYSLAAALNEQRQGHTPIYLYEEPIQNGGPLKMSLHEQANSMAEEILEIRQNSPLPYILVGFSFGSIEAYETALILSALNHDPRLYVIDEPSVSCVKKYFDADSTKFKSDLVSIVNYAATLSGLQSIVAENNILTAIQYLELEDRIDYLANASISKQQEQISEDAISTFYLYLEIAKRNLRNLALSDSKPSQKLDNVHLIYTKETAQKYGAEQQDNTQFTGGWDQCSRKINILNQDLSSTLGKQKHMDLLKAGNASLVADLISKNLQNEITEEYLKVRHIQAILGKSLQPDLINQLIGKMPQASVGGQKRASMHFFSAYNDAQADRPQRPTIHDKNTIVLPQDQARKLAI